ncbi:MAG TPA: cytochrome c-type biogenesis protein CcmH [Hellea balneolensis]|uniref:Cytochrome c-type biogenesis protein n=1 Tax=Hellea balneolensis TaxID=287478 RepID=A0A7C3C4X3_9PROT|nr:cytochrome c-type biogenesis protein CcmH [Hellea balneolensis]
MKRLLAIILVLLLSVAAHGQTISKAEVDVRAKEIGQSLRCVVCQNQSIEESNAPLAADMRTMVRERVIAGDSDAQVVEFMRSRYGDFVLLKPPFQTNTYVLWIMPAFMLVLAFLWYGLRARNRKRVIEVTPLTDDEKTKLEQLMHDDI